MLNVEIRPHKFFHEGKWKVSDFGIARFVEQATSLNTLKSCLTPPYAAPEQWELKRSTNSTDIYALGCIGYTLLIGSPPFIGPSIEDYRNRHLNEKPPTINNHNPVLVNLLSMMLRKNQEVRPSASRVKHILEKTVNTYINLSDRSGLNKLADAGARVAKREAEREVLIKQDQELIQTRRKIAVEAYSILGELIQNLHEGMLDVLPNAKSVDNILTLENAQLVVFMCSHGDFIPSNAFSKSGWDVVAGAIISVTQIQPQYIWSSNLWFMKPDPSSDYRWYEVSYMDLPGFGSECRHQHEPFAIDNIEDADYAASNFMHIYQIAWGPRPIDQVDSEDFYNRWEVLFANALNRRLTHPTRMPIPKNYFD